MHSWQTLILRLSCKSFCTSSVPVVYCFILILILMCHIGLASLMSSEIKVALKIRWRTRQQVRSNTSRCQLKESSSRSDEVDEMMNGATWYSTQGPFMRGGIDSVSLSTGGPSQSRELMLMQVGILSIARLTCQEDIPTYIHRLYFYYGLEGESAPIKIPRKSSFIRPLRSSSATLSVIVKPWCGSPYLTLWQELKRMLSMVVIPWDTSDCRTILNTSGMGLFITVDN